MPDPGKLLKEILCDFVALTYATKSLRMWCLGKATADLVGRVCRTGCIESFNMNARDNQK
jgi:hypothetical protein